MKQSIIGGQEVVIYASRLSRKKDQTSTVKNISSEEIEILPVEDLAAVVNMQAGVVAGHFRGGRIDEVSYMIDGVPVNDAFGGVSSVSTLEVEAVKDLEVITGTFNAEYGNAMSGIVNAVTKDGSNNFQGSINTGYSTYATDNSKNGEEVFIGLDPFGINSNSDVKLGLSGPIIKDRLYFFSNYRTQSVNGHLNGIRRFEVWNLSDFYDQDSSNWFSENTGDSSYVPMNKGAHTSFMGKLSFNFGNIKFSWLLNKNNSLLCIGLDPDPNLLPIKDIALFNREIIDATKDLVCCYKPNLAFYESLGMDGLLALEQTIAHIPGDIPIIGDAKRGDIGSTAHAYAKALFDVWQFDAVTVNPYLGKDSLDPFIDYKEKGVFVLCHTSNPGASDFQELTIQADQNSYALFQHNAVNMCEGTPR